MARITAQNYQSYMKGSNRHIDTHTREMYLGDSPTVQAGYGTYDSKSTAHKVACYMFSLNDSATENTPCEDIPRGFTVAVEENNTVVEYQYKKPMPSGGYTAADLEVKSIANVDASDVSYGNSNVGTALLGIEENVHTLRDDVGVISDLETTYKQDLVEAVNEVNTKANNANTKIGTLTSLHTTDKTTVVDAINEVKDAIPTSMSAENVTYSSSGSHTSGSIAEAMYSAEQGILSLESKTHDLRDDVGILSNLDTPAQNLVSAINSGITSASDSATAAAASSAAAQQASTSAVNAAQSVLDELDNFPASQDATVLQHGTRITALESTSVHDLSVMYSSSYASLSAALTALNADTNASAIKVGGMNIKFINSTTNKYEQWVLKASSFSTTESDWVSVTDVKAEDVSYGESNVGDALDKTHEILNDIDVTVNGVKFSNSGYVSKMGNNVSNSDFKCTDYISISQVDTIVLKNTTKGGGGGVNSFGNVEFFKEKGEVSDITPYIEVQLSITTITLDSTNIPDDARYIVCNAEAGADASVKINRGPIIEQLSNPDTSLRIPHAAAESKAVGDALDSLIVTTDNQNDKVSALIDTYVKSKNIFDKDGEIAVYSDGVVTLPDDTTIEFTVGNVIDTLPDVMIRNLALNKYNGFVSNSYMVLSKKYPLYQDYVISGTNLNDGYGVCIFDTDGVKRGFTSGSVIHKDDYPRNCYFRVSIFTPSTAQIEKGDVATAYEPYTTPTAIIKKISLPFDYEATKKKLDAAYDFADDIKIERTVPASVNIFDKNGDKAVWSDGVVTKSDGTTMEFPDRTAIDTLPDELVEGLAIHQYQKFSANHFCSVSKKYVLDGDYYISGQSIAANYAIGIFDANGNRVYLTTSNQILKEDYPLGKYFRFTIVNEYIDNIQVEKGTSATPYVPYSEAYKIISSKCIADEIREGVRYRVYIHTTDTEEEIMHKMLNAVLEGNRDVIFDFGIYTFTDALYDAMYEIPYFRSVGAYELPLGGNCRYYFNGATIKLQRTTMNGTCNAMGCVRRNCGNFYLYDGIIDVTNGAYCVHDEGQAAQGSYVHEYHNMKMIYRSSGNELGKCIGGGTGLFGSVIVDSCILISYNTDNAFDLSWHGILHGEQDESYFKLVVKNNYLSKGLSLDRVGANQYCDVLYTGNSANAGVNNTSGTASHWTVYNFCNEIRQ